MNFYRISVSECSPKRFAWAACYGPLPSMPFFDSLSEEVRDRLRASWLINKSKPGITIDQGGRSWSDILGCGGSLSEFYSERVIDSLRAAEISFLRCTEMPIAEIRSKQLKEIPPPKYYVLEAEPGMSVRSENVPIEQQIAARNEQPPRWTSPVRTFGKLDTWNGCDIFSPLHGKALTSIFCTERVKKLAECKGWTNVEFAPIEIE